MSGCGTKDLRFHSITVPLHQALKTGVLHGILSEVAQMRSMSDDSILELL